MIEVKPTIPLLQLLVQKQGNRRANDIGRVPYIDNLHLICLILNLSKKSSGAKQLKKIMSTKKPTALAGTNQRKHLWNKPKIQVWVFFYPFEKRTHYCTFAKWLFSCSSWKEKSRANNLPSEESIPCFEELSFNNLSITNQMCYNCT